MRARNRTLRNARNATAAALAALVLGIPGAALAAPANDARSDAAPLALPSSAVQSTSGATLEAGEAQPSCLPAGSQAGATVWFRAELAAPGRIVATTFGSKFDTVLAVYAGTGEVACSDDDLSTGSLQSTVSFLAGAGTYLLQAGGIDGASGYLRVAIKADTRPLNDLRAAATPIPALPYADAVDVRQATGGDEEAYLSCAPMGHSVWYRLDPSVDVGLEVVSARSDFDTVLAAFRDTGAGIEEVACSDDAEGLTSRLLFRARAGETYWIAGGGFAEDAGLLAIDATVGTLPANDDFGDALEMGSLPFTHEIASEGASREDGEPDGSCAPWWPTPTLWYRVEVAETTPLALSTRATEFDTVVAVWEGGALGALGEVACSDESGATSTSLAGWVAQPGRTYYVQVSSWYPDESGIVRVRLTRGAQLGPVAGVAADPSGAEAGAGATLFGTGAAASAASDERGTDAAACVWADYSGFCAG